MNTNTGHSSVNSDSLHVLVTGGTGALGPELVRQLWFLGYGVRVICRRPPPPEVFPRGVELIIGDIADRDCLRKAVDGVKYVFHLAAKLHITDPRPADLPEYWRVNADGTRCVVEASLAAGVQRLVYFSTISVYGPTRGKCADEDTPPHPESVYAKTKLAGEEFVLAARTPQSEKLLGVVLRMAAIYGPRMKGNYPTLVKALSRRMFFSVGDGSNRRTLVFEQDAVRAAILVAQHPEAAGRIYNVSDGRIYCVRDIIASICRAIGSHPPRFFLPLGPARLLARGVDRIAGAIRLSPNLTVKVDKFIEDAAVCGERLRVQLGFQPLFDLDRGWRETIAAWRSSRPREES